MLKKFTQLIGIIFLAALISIASQGKVFAGNYKSSHVASCMKLNTTSVKSIAACLVAKYGYEAAVEMAKILGLEAIWQTIIALYGSSKNEPAPPVPYNLKK